MTRFIQLHTLTSYPPANLNRDDLGRPKTAIMGGFERLRVSSQSLKRHWRTSDAFQSALRDHLGTRTKDIGVRVRESLLSKGVKEKDAEQWAYDIASVFGKVEKGKVTTQQLVFVSPDEWNAIEELAQKLADENRKPEDDEKKALLKKSTAVDIALFGRMLADASTFNIEAACQVAHAISVHSVSIEDDYFTAVDDLNSDHEDRGAAHIGEAGFAAAVFYSYVCIDRQSLLENLNGDEALTSKAIAALIESIATVSPKGKRNSFGSFAYASYMMAETGNKQPRSLSAAFLSPVTTDYLNSSINALEEQAAMFDKVYGPCAEQRVSFNAVKGEGNLQSLIETVCNP